MAASAARHWPGAAQGSGRGVVVFFWGRAFSCCPERLWWCVPDTYLPSFPGTRIYTRPFGSAGGVVPASCPWLGQAVPMRVHAPIVTPGRSRVPAPAGRARVIHLWLLCVYRYNPPSHPFPPPDLSRGTGAFAIARRPPHPYPRHSLAGCWSRLTAASTHPPPPYNRPPHATAAAAAQTVTEKRLACVAPCRGSGSSPPPLPRHPPLSLLLPLLGKGGGD